MLLIRLSRGSSSGGGGVADSSFGDAEEGLGVERDVGVTGGEPGVTTPWLGVDAPLRLPIVAVDVDW